MGAMPVYSVADLLKSQEIEGIHLIAGAGGVGNEISCINIMDNPDSFDWLISGEFLLSTGYIFKDDEALQRKVVRQLAEIGCSGLGLKLRRYLAEIPACMAEEAEELNFPLIELPFGHSLSKISTVINDNIYKQGKNRIDRALTIHRELTKASLQSRGLREIARTAAGFLDNPILIFDSNWRLLCWEDCPNNPHPIQDHIPTTHKAAVLPKEFTDRMPNKLDMFKKPITRRLSLPDGAQIICRVMPVGAYGKNLYGYLVVWETVRTLDAPDYLAMEQVSISVAIERSLAREIEEIKIRMKRDFFDELLSGNIDSMSAMRSLAAMHGMNPEGRYRCLLIRHNFDGHEKEAADQRQLSAWSERCREICHRIANESGISVISVPHSLQTILLLEIHRDKTASDRQTRQFAEDLRNGLSADSGRTPSIVISAPADDIARIADVFADVQRTLRLVRAPVAGDSIIFVEDYAVFHLMDKFIDKKHLLAFAQRSLGKLIEHDRKNGTQLLQTLDAYFLLSGNITEAARLIFVHRNTYGYRLDKIKTLLEDDFTNSMKLLEYQVALLALKITGE
jgi:purine catabolism regulator